MQYNYDNNIYTVSNCTYEDIPSHIERVLSYWKDTDIDKQKELLTIAINSNTAYKLVDINNISKSMIYCVPLQKQTVMSNLFWFENKRMLAMLAYYLTTSTNISKILFMPHTKDRIPFSFLVEDTSIRLFHSHNTPLEVDLHSKKSMMLYFKQFKKYNIQVL